MKPSLPLALSLLVAVLPLASVAAPFPDPLDDVAGFRAEKGYGCAEVKLSTESQAREGKGAVRVVWRAMADKPGAGGFEKRFEPTDFRSTSFTVWVNPVANVGSVFVALYDESGKRVEMRAWHNRRGWSELRWVARGKGDANHREGGEPAALERVARILFYANTSEPGVEAEALWDALEPLK